MCFQPMNVWNNIRGVGSTLKKLIENHIGSSYLLTLTHHLKLTGCQKITSKYSWKWNEDHRIDLKWSLYRYLFPFAKPKFIKRRQANTNMVLITEQAKLKRFNNTLWAVAAGILSVVSADLVNHFETLKTSVLYLTGDLRFTTCSNVFSLLYDFRTRTKTAFKNGYSRAYVNEVLRRF